ncbi:CehA/McbA family metallohydrolase [Algoriphagus sp. CAU 1675]|uniref:CehA/McbA family metallohydrolase n=1 Tax=Algoriphagus sp. CAU 1675 TaxID=3032597 RepID=UPI0023DA2C16|nr:CehA/McbA family metallohydrolase [Algoriphagus sp. CAU 1675]MDF2156748.1 CehA/McbA family metallohydrolase [Algoriphagus sp. CAU 1675]
MYNLTRRVAGLLISALVQVLTLTVVSAQWTNHYSKLSDFGHHVYLEQHELPILVYGPTDPAPAPDGKQLAFAARGWIWNLNLETGTAIRLTKGSGIDSRPRWSPDGKKLTFVRDEGKNTAIIVRDLASGEEKRIDTETIELDPEFSSDGEWIYYTSGKTGSLNLRRYHLLSGEDEPLTDLRQVERNPRRLNDGESLMYLHGNGAHRVLRIRNFQNNTDSIALAQTLTYHLTADAHPAQRLIVYSAPIDNDYHLWTMDLDDPRVKHRLTDGNPFALTPAFSADGEQIFFVELDENRQFKLMQIPTYGGEAKEVKILNWDLREASGSLKVNVTDESGKPITARISILREDGYPVPSHENATYVDPQTGRHYFYLEGEASFSLPAGNYQVIGVQGPMTPITQSTIQVIDGGSTEVSLTISPIWDAKAAGYASADHHVHLNGDGHHRATHQDALQALEGEDLDLLAPMSWNRWERRIDASLIGKETEKDGRIVTQSQEVRSHFHGHVSLLGTDKAYAPWFWGPTNPKLGDPDRSNGEVVDFADQTGAFLTYVHPITEDLDPFDHLDDNPIPIELISDGVLAERIGFEMVCAWTSPLGNSHVWYRLLNIGRPVAAMSGTDMWVDFHRTMAVGTGRNYVRLEGEEMTSEAVLEAAMAGKGFVTTGPALLFQVGEKAKPGDVVSSGTQDWTATLASTSAIDVVELIVNGEVVEKLDEVNAGETRNYKGKVTLPEGGWVAIRAYAGEQREDSWPSMHARPFAHSSPVWIEAIGSTDPNSRKAAAADLIRAIDAAEGISKAAYGDTEMNRMMSRFEEARKRLREMIK